MSDPPTFTTFLNERVARLRQGDRSARDELLQSVSSRLQMLTQRMLLAYPLVRRWADAEDVLQNATMRLLRALEVTQPGSTRDFMNLAAVQIRRELIDLARHFGGPLGIGRHHGSVADFGALSVAEASSATSGELEHWADLHTAVAALPEEEQEVFQLIFYHGCQHGDAAEICNVHVRTIRRRWHSALLRLKDVLGRIQLD